jgi:hypothetical protein
MDYFIESTGQTKRDRTRQHSREEMQGEKSMDHGPYTLADGGRAPAD